MLILETGSDFPRNYSTALNLSDEAPVYVGKDGYTELYKHEGRTLRVGPHQIIDNHGNVIDLARQYPFLKLANG